MTKIAIIFVAMCLVAQLSHGAELRHKRRADEDAETTTQHWTSEFQDGFSKVVNEENWNKTLEFGKNLFDKSKDLTQSLGEKAKNLWEQATSQTTPATNTA